MKKHLSISSTLSKIDSVLDFLETHYLPFGLWTITLGSWILTSFKLDALPGSFDSKQLAAIIGTLATVSLAVTFNHLKSIRDEDEVKNGKERILNLLMRIQDELSTFWAHIPGYTGIILRNFRHLYERGMEPRPEPSLALEKLLEELCKECKSLDDSSSLYRIISAIDNVIQNYNVWKGIIAQMRSDLSSPLKDAIEEFIENDNSCEVTPFESAQIKTINWFVVSSAELRECCFVAIKEVLESLQKRGRNLDSDDKIDLFTKQESTFLTNHNSDDSKGPIFWQQAMFMLELRKCLEERRLKKRHLILESIAEGSKDKKSA